MYITFANGTSFTAEEAQALQDQGIPVFADATARDNAIPAPSDGQHCHLLSTNRTYVYNAGWIESLQLEDSGWTDFGNIASGWTVASGGYAKYRVLNGVFYFHIEVTRASWTAGTTVLTVPGSYLPSAPQTFIATFSGSFYELNLNFTTGALNVQQAGTGGIWVSGSFPVG